MKEQLVSFETAKLAKEKGFYLNDAEPLFDEQYKCYFSDEHYIDFFDSCNFEKLDIILAPTQSLLQKWLREVHNIELFVYRTLETEEGYKYGCEGEKWSEESTEDLFNFYAKTYEEVLEVGLIEALKLIK